jgi:N-methylhydantoinase B
MKFLQGGTPDETLLLLLKRNVRTPEQTVGDLWAQVVALDLMEERLVSLMRAYRLADLHALAAAIHGRCEAAMRSAIRALPDGTYHSTLQTDGLMARPITLRLALTVAGDEMIMDYAGSDAQVDRAINCAYCYTFAMSVYGAKICTSPNLPNNEGAWRPITVRAPERSIVNPLFPASGGSRMLIGHYLPMLVFGCLGQVVPERVMAASGSPMWGMNQSGVCADGTPYANMFFFNGGMGGKSDSDGAACLSWPSNVSSTSVEVSEHLAPMRILHKRLREGSGGAGRHRGGLGQDILIEMRGKAAVSFLAERTVIPAFGIEGGGSGALGVLQINGEAVDPKRQYVINHGDTIRLATPGGGGHGDPQIRGEADRRRDARLNY